MSKQNPHVQSPHIPSPEEAIQPTSPDFVETPDIEPLSKEREPFPVWLYLACGFALFFAGSSFTGIENFGSGLLDQGPGGPVVNTHAMATVEAPASPMDVGKKLYAGNCASCHQASGVGAPGAYPPLVGSEWVLGNKERLSAIMLAGLSGPLTVKGGAYGTQVMPGWAAAFNDDKLSDIMTYIRGSWGNTANPVKSDELAAARTKFTPHLAAPYSEADLKAIAPDGPDPSDKK
jgi:mono/diheme cytochrome c family protein